MATGHKREFPPRPTLLESSRFTCDRLIVSEGERTPLAPVIDSMQSVEYFGEQPQPVRRRPRWRSSARLVAYICSWYAISISITLYNKWLFSVYDFHFPLLITTVHVGLKMPAARLAMRAFRLPPIDFSHPAATRRLLLGILPTGITMSGDIALSNLSMLYISVTYYTIVKSTVPLWILLFSVLMKIQKMQIKLLLTVLCVGAGIALASAPEPAGARHGALPPESDGGGAGGKAAGGGAAGSGVYSGPGAGVYSGPAGGRPAAVYSGPGDGGAGRRSMLWRAPHDARGHAPVQKIRGDPPPPEMMPGGGEPYRGFPPPPPGLLPGPIPVGEARRAAAPPLPAGAGAGLSGGQAPVGGDDVPIPRAVQRGGEDGQIPVGEEPAPALRLPRLSGLDDLLLAPAGAPRRSLRRRAAQRPPLPAPAPSPPPLRVAPTIVSQQTVTPGGGWGAAGVNTQGLAGMNGKYGAGMNTAGLAGGAAGERFGAGRATSVGHTGAGPGSTAVAPTSNANTNPNPNSIPKSTPNAMPSPDVRPTTRDGAGTPSTPGHTDAPAAIAAAIAAAAAATEAAAAAAATSLAPEPLPAALVGGPPPPLVSSAQAIGCLLVVLSSMCAGFRWACTQLLLTSPPASGTVSPPTSGRGSGRAPSHSSPCPMSPELGSGPPSCAASPDLHYGWRSTSLAEMASLRRSRPGRRTSVRSRPGGAADTGGGGLMHPLVLLYYISPFGFLALLPVALAVEASSLADYLAASTTQHMVVVTALTAVGGLASCFLLITEMQVVKLSSGLSLSVAGIFKELLTVIASVLILGDTLTTRNASGLLLCLVGIGYYTYVKQAEPARMPDHTTPPMRRPPTPVVEVCELPPAPEADGSGYDEEGRDEEGRDGS